MTTTELRELHRKFSYCLPFSDDERREIIESGQSEGWAELVIESVNATPGLLERVAGLEEENGRLRAGLRECLAANPLVEHINLGPTGYVCRGCHVAAGVPRLIQHKADCLWKRIDALLGSGK